MPGPYRGFCFFPHPLFYIAMKSQRLQSFQCQAFHAEATTEPFMPLPIQQPLLEPTPDPAVAVATTAKSPKVSSLKSGLWEKSNRSMSTPRGEICFLTYFWYGKHYLTTPGKHSCGSHLKV